MTRKPSRVQVKCLDLFALLEQGVADLRGRGVIEEDDTLTATWHWGVVPTERGHFLICDEGVGPTAPLEEEPGAIDLYTRSPKGFGVLPVARLRLSLDNAKDAMSGEVKPLHEFIRTFGNRLEANYREWDEFLTR
jgi:hypothetical protein